MAWSQGGVISRRQLLEVGVDRWRTRSYLRAGRWKGHFRQTIAVHTGPLSPIGMCWAGVFEAGPRGVLDGVSSLIAAGLTGFSVDRVRVSVPRGARVLRSRAIDVRQTRRWRAADIEPAGIPRTRTEVAAVRAALWARTDRQAALILAMVVQQRLATPGAIGAALLAVRRHRRRRFIEGVLLDLMGGAETLGELDLARGCRERLLPEPSRQVVRLGRSGTYILDVRWEESGVVVEVDGIHHVSAQRIVQDALRQNDLVLEGDLVLRLPLLGLRVAEAAFYSQIEAALVSRGWRRSAA